MAAPSSVIVPLPAPHSHPLLPPPQVIQPTGQQFAAPVNSHHVSQMLRGERHLFSTLDDNVMMKQIQVTHAPDGRIVDVKPLLHIIEDILQRSTPPGIDSLLHPSSQAHIDAMDDKSHQGGFLGMHEALAYTIHKISCEISCKCSGGGDAKATTVALFNLLSSYSWDAKVVLVLAAFAVNYGEFWLVAQPFTTNQLAKSIALLKQLPDIVELKPRFDALKTLIKAMMDVTNCIIELTDLPINPEVPVMVTAWARVRTAVYWTITSVVACASQIIGLIGLGHEHITSTTEAWELSSLAHKVENIHDLLGKQLALCNQYIVEKRRVDAYQTLIQLFETIHNDNMKVLSALIYAHAHDDILPLWDGSEKKSVNLVVLRRKSVLLLITDLDFSHEEFSILDQMYTEARHQPNRPESVYEVVWLPVVDKTDPWTEEKHHKFQTLQSMMPWYSVNKPSIIEPAVIKYIKEVWRFTKKAILVVLDPQGRVANPNALHMMWIWGSQAYPFTSLREDALWKEEAWRMERLVDQNILPSLNKLQGKLICLCGGEDIKWIRKFTLEAQKVSQAIGKQLELVYVGKSNPKERVKSNIKIISDEKLSIILPDLTSIRIFWVRLESMWYSKMQHGKRVEDDPIMKEIQTMLTFDGSEQGWAVVSQGSSSQGSSEMAKAKAETIFKSFVEIEQWKENVSRKGFVLALIDHLHGLQTSHHCNRLILPGTTGSIPEQVVCSECGRAMEKYIMFLCCTD